MRGGILETLRIKQIRHFARQRIGIILRLCHLLPLSAYVSLLRHLARIGATDRESAGSKAEAVSELIHVF